MDVAKTHNRGITWQNRSLVLGGIAIAILACGIIKSLPHLSQIGTPSIAVGCTIAAVPILGFLRGSYLVHKASKASSGRLL